MHFIEPLTADEANRRRKRPDVVQDGERVHFDINFRDDASGTFDSQPAPGRMYITDAAQPSAPTIGRPGPICDAAPAGVPKSIDAALQEAIAAAAKTAGMKPSEWLAKQSQRDIEKLVETTAKNAVQAAGAEGIAKSFAMDSVEAARRAWLKDKATAYQSHRSSSIAAPGPVTQPAADAAPKPQTEQAARAAIADARSARLARLESAYKG